MPYTETWRTNAHGETYRAYEWYDAPDPDGPRFTVLAEVVKSITYRQDGVSRRLEHGTLVWASWVQGGRIWVHVGDARMVGAYNADGTEKPSTWMYRTRARVHLYHIAGTQQAAPDGPTEYAGDLTAAVGRWKAAHLKRARRANAPVETVTIPAQGQGWGVMTIRLHWICPFCGGPRGKVQDVLYQKWQRWENPCGHVDGWEDVREEARANGLNDVVGAGK
jgi:hypothetical protein